MATPGSYGIFRLAPPLTEEIDETLLILDQAFAAVFPADAYQSVAAEAYL